MVPLTPNLYNLVNDVQYVENLVFLLISVSLNQRKVEASDNVEIGDTRQRRIHTLIWSSRSEPH